ncbi:MAG: glycosyltransferase family 4 protein [Saprospiraceae bacterium]|nr:glycosyltransferase family 4 protein [Saprospiraceae bacterium]MDZ4702991.1 glycosyltransferase family 4 protein [Saprospiraceae bacterium]
MRILQVCKKFPFPLKDGEAIAVNSLSKALSSLGCEVTLLAMNTRKHYFNLHQLPNKFNHYADIHTVEIDNRIKPRDAFLNLFSKESYHISRFVSSAFQEQLVRLLRKGNFDMVQLETLYLAPYIPIIRQHSDAMIAMRAHNVESEIWSRIAENSTWGPKKWYLNHLTQKLRDYEIAQLSHYDMLVAISARDLDTFQTCAPVQASTVAPVGIDTEDYIPNYGSFAKPLTMAFIGSLDWMPNQEGLKWFLNQVWPKLQKRFPKLVFHIAGRNTPDWIMRLNLRNVTVHGEVQDASEFINQHSVMVVPLLSGSGMRVKILEGMALGKVAITTRLGLEGIDARHKSEVILADTAEDFIKGIEFCYQKGAKLEKMGRRAQEFVLQHYDSVAIAKKLLKVYAAMSVEAV